MNLTQRRTELAVGKIEHLFLADDELRLFAKQLLVCRPFVVGGGGGGVGSSWIPFVSFDFF